jgi:hypothetical protein
MPEPRALPGEPAFASRRKDPRWASCSPRARCRRAAHDRRCSPCCRAAGWPRRTPPAAARTGSQSLAIVSRRCALVAAPVGIPADRTRSERLNRATMGRQRAPIRGVAALRSDGTV